MNDWKTEFTKKFPNTDSACPCCMGNVQNHSKGGEIESFISTVEARARKEEKSELANLLEANAPFWDQTPEHRQCRDWLQEVFLKA